jgi:hypothetical protein
MSMLEINAATVVSVTEIGAGGTGKAGGSNAQKPHPDPASLDVQPDNGKSQSSTSPENLNVEPARSPVPDSALPPRGPHEPADQPAQISTRTSEPANWPDPKSRAQARQDRIDEADQAARDGGSIPPRA